MMPMAMSISEAAPGDGSVDAPARPSLFALSASLLLCGGLAVALFLTLAPPADSVLSLPAPGETRADYLGDGTPVFVVRHADGTVSVISAFSGHVPSVAKLDWWCPATRQFEDPFHGSRWDEWGSRLSGPSPRDLATMPIRSVASDNSTVNVERGDLLGPPGAPGDAGALVELCTKDDSVSHAFNGWPILAPAEIGGHQGWVLVLGTLIQGPGSEARLCPSGVASIRCPDGADVQVTTSRPSPHVVLSESMESGAGVVWLARVRGNSLVDVAAIYP